MTNGLKATQEHNYTTIQNEIKELENEVVECSSHTPVRTQDILRKIATVLHYEVLTNDQAETLTKQISNQTEKFDKKCKCLNK